MKFCEPESTLKESAGPLTQMYERAMYFYEKSFHMGRSMRISEDGKTIKFDRKNTHTKPNGDT